MQPSLKALDLSGSLDWNRLAAGHPGAGVFHRSEWITAVAEAYRLKPLAFIAQDAKGEQALVPLMEVDSIGSRRAVSLPFTDFCDPLLTDAPAGVRLWDELIQCGRSRQWRSIELRGGAGLVDPKNASISFYGHVLDLTGTVSELNRRLDGSVRRAIRKAERDGVTVERSNDLRSVQEYYRLHVRTRQRHGLPPQPFRFFARIHERLISKGLGSVFLARHQGAAIAGALYLHYGQMALFKFGASDKTCQVLRANDLVMWRAIQYFSDQGCRSLHFGRTSKANAGLRRFKLGWGTEESEIRYFKYDLKHSAFVKEEDKAFGWHNPLFRLMPAWLARLAGSLLYRRFA